MIRKLQVDSITLVVQALVASGTVDQERISQTSCKITDLYSFTSLRSFNLSVLLDVNRAINLQKMFKRIPVYQRYLLNTVQDYLERASELEYLLLGTLPSRDETNRLFQLTYLMVMFDVHSDLVKYWINNVFCKTYDLERPQSKFDFVSKDWIFTERSCAWLNLKGGKNHRFRTSVREKITTIFMGFKKGLKPVSPLKIAESALKHEKALTKTSTMPEQLLNDIERKARSLLRGWFPPALDNCQRESSSASFENSRREGGSLHGLVKRYTGLDSLSFVSKEFIGYYTVRRPLQPPEIIPFYSAIPDVRTMLRDTLDYEPELKVRPAFILEPLKVRVVTMSSELGQRYFSSIQKSLWSHLQKMPCFELIGRPLQHDDIRTLVEKLGPMEKMLSGDWSAATDNLKSEITQVISDLILTKVWGREQNLKVAMDVQSRLKESLSQNKIHYDTTKMFPKMGFEVNWESAFGESREVDQNDGQLMGHKISFLILCMANACIHWISREKEEQRRLSMDIALAECYFNGDDYLATCTILRYMIWEAISKECGLEKSVGKNFFSRDLCQINSETFFIKWDNEDFPKVFKSYFVNFGLLLGRGKGMDPLADNYPQGRDHFRFLHVLQSGMKKNTECASDDYITTEGSLYSVYRSLTTGLIHTLPRVIDLWRTQMDYLRDSMKKNGISVPLPSDGVFENSLFDPLAYCTTFDDRAPEIVQYNFPSNILDIETYEPKFNMKKRIRRSKQVHVEFEYFPGNYRSLWTQVQKAWERKNTIVTQLHY